MEIPMLLFAVYIHQKVLAFDDAQRRVHHNVVEESVHKDCTVRKVHKVDSTMVTLGEQKRHVYVYSFPHLLEV